MIKFNVGDRVKVISDEGASMRNVKDKFGHILEISEVWPNEQNPLVSIEFADFIAWVPINNIRETK